MFRILFLLVISIISVCQASPLEKVDDEELLRLIQTEKYVVALFTKKDCEACDNLENIMIHLREDLVDTMSAWVLKVENSQLLQLYSPDKEPALVFFRHGLPLLYNGPINDEDILTMFTENKEPTVKGLTDENFEHLTQASSGATTGDWFVMFTSYGKDCMECLRMAARWEAVGAKLKYRVNVARMDKHTDSAATSRRFKISQLPAFILFRHGKMYRYEIPRYDVNSLVSFAEEWYKNVHAEKVPVPQSPFDDFTQMIADVLLENPWIMKLASIIIGVFIIVSIASKLKRKAETPQKKEK